MILTLLKSNHRLMTSQDGSGNLLPVKKETQRAFYIGSEDLCPCAG